MKSPKTSSSDMMRMLRQQVCAVETAGRADGKTVISSGCEALDRLLPAGGFVPGQLIEWLADGSGSGAGTLAMIAAGQACRSGGALVVTDRDGSFYPPAAVAWGIDLQRLIVIRAHHEKDQLWALVQVLRCPGVAAVWAPLDRLDQRGFRRLQLAVENGGGLGFLLRGAGVRGRPSWSDVQLLVQARPSLTGARGDSPLECARRLRIELVRCRGGTGGGWVELEIDETTGMTREAVAARQETSLKHETRSLHLATQLAHPTTRRRSARA